MRYFLILDKTFAFFLKITKILTSYFELWRTSSRNVLSWRTYLRKEFVLDEMFSLFFINEAFLHLSHWKNWVQRIKAVVKLTVCLLAYTIALDLRRIRDDSVSIQTQCDSVRYWSLFNLRNMHQCTWIKCIRIILLSVVLGLNINFVIL